VPRGTLLERARDTAAGEEGTLLILGTRGMGKSVFLGDLKEKLKGTARLEVLFFSQAPPTRGTRRTVPELVEKLLDELIKNAQSRLEDDKNHERQSRSAVEGGEPDGRLKQPKSEFGALATELRLHADKLRVQELLETYCDHFSDEIDRLVLLYDELEGYAEEGSVAGQHYFDALEDARKNMDGELAIVAAGGLGMLSLRVLAQGSSMFSRASRHILTPFRDEDIALLAEDFQPSTSTLPEDVLPALRVFSGGNPMLVTYGLDQLWKAEQPSTTILSKAFDEFRDREDPYFVQSVLKPVFDPKYGRLPAAAWRALNRANGRLSQAELRELRREASPELALDGRDFFDMLRASGLVIMTDSAWREDPAVVELVPSILRSEVDDVIGEADHVSEAGRQSSLQGQLRKDLILAIADIQRMTPAFYRPGTKNEEKKLVPEATFAAAIALVLNSRGWRTELEAMSGAGFTELKGFHPSFDKQEAIVEVKIWGRKYKEIHDQVTSYFARGVTAMATVMVTDQRSLSGSWSQAYERECLTGKVEGKPLWRPLQPPLEGYFEAQSSGLVVEHFLLCLPSRA
jgi:hypothetical protein